MKRFARDLFSLGGFTVAREPRPLLKTAGSRMKPSFDMAMSFYLLRKGSRPFFVQVGAYDGVDGDPLHQYVKRGMMSGCLLEPQSQFFDQLRSNYGGIPGLVFKRVAIGPAAGEQTLYRVRPGTPGPGWLHQIASFRREVVLKHARDVPGLEAAIISEVVPVITFDDLFDELQVRPDIVVVDTEGYDSEVVKQLLATGCRPGLIHYEHKHLSKNDRDECLGLLIACGYRIALGDADTTALLPLPADREWG